MVVAPEVYKGECKIRNPPRLITMSSFQCLPAPLTTYQGNIRTLLDGRPAGVSPEHYIGRLNIQKHNGIRCALCEEEMTQRVPLLLLPRKRVNVSKNNECIHVYTPRRSAIFYWNTDGSTFTIRVDGSAELRTPSGLVKKYGAGTYKQLNMPLLPNHLSGIGAMRSRSETYFEQLFQLHHPLAGSADEEFPRRMEVRKLEVVPRVRRAKQL